jgi:glucose/mannose-6-phosphate isomerase
VTATGLDTTGSPLSRALDTEGMLEAVASLPEQVASAIDAGRHLDGLPHRDGVEQVVVLGMGGSGLAGDVLVAVAGPFLPVPVTVVKSYELPDSVGRESLVFAVSFSGDTEETVEAAGEAFEAGASVVAVTGGGGLQRLAEDWGAPVVPVPKSIPQPRCAIGAVSIPPLVVLEDMGLFPGATRWIELAVDQLRRRRDQLLAPGSDAEVAARRIGRTIPLVYGAQAVGATAAVRWKNQVNENAKSPAFCSVYPELGHNELAGWGQLGDVTRQLITLVNLRHDAEHPQVARRFAIVTEMLREVMADVIEVRAQGDGDLAQLLDLALVGDFVSLHMAAAEGVDPGPIPALVELKQRLRSA